MEHKSFARFVCLALVLVGLGAASLAAHQERTPNQTILRFYNALAGENPNEAQPFVSAALAAKVKQDGGFARLISERIGELPIKGVQVVNVQVKGQTANAAVRLHWPDGRTKDLQDVLVKEGGQWKITVKPAAR